MDEKDRKFIRLIGVLSTVGLTLVFATVIGLFIGIKIDKWLGTSPWFTAIFLFIGIAAGFRNLFIYSKRSQQTFDKDDKNGRNGKDNHDD
jgi:F0F1-type ATP synthase assembly protein I